MATATRLHGGSIPKRPTLHLGWNGDDLAALPASLAFDRDGDGEADHGTVLHLPPGTRDGDHVRFSGFAITVPVESASGRFGTLFLQDVLLEMDFTTATEPGDTVEAGTLRASVAVDELIALLATTGVLEREDIIMILGDIFGFDGADPPGLVTVELAIAGERIAAL